jgi:hypothetical protein
MKQILVPGDKNTNYTYLIDLPVNASGVKSLRSALPDLSDLSFFVDDFLGPVFSDSVNDFVGAAFSNSGEGLRRTSVCVTAFWSFLAI